ISRDRQRAAKRNRTPDDAQTSYEVLLQTRNLHRAHLRHHLDASISEPRKRDNRSTRVIIFARYAMAVTRACVFPMRRPDKHSSTRAREGTLLHDVDRRIQKRRRSRWSDVCVVVARDPEVGKECATAERGLVAVCAA